MTSQKYFQETKLAKFALANTFKTGVSLQPTITHVEGRIQLQVCFTNRFDRGNNQENNLLKAFIIS